MLALLLLALLASPRAANRAHAAGALQQPVAPLPGAHDVVPDPGDIPPARTVIDPYPALNGVAVDPDSGLVVVSDPNKHSLLLYDRARGTGDAETLPIRQIIGPQTEIGQVAGVLVDPQHREVYTANNDIEDTVVVMPYHAVGNAAPTRVLSVPHQAWGLALGPKHDELAVTVEIYNAIVFYRREAKSVEPPVRVIRGPHTGMADPHGIAWDEEHNEIVVANHGNFRGLMKDTGAGCEATSPAEAEAETGEYQAPSLRFYNADGKNDEDPARTIQGDKTQLDWPMGVAVDPAHNEVAVANNGDNSLLIFSRARGGDVAPVRAIRGPRTGINRPMGVAVDARNGEIWVTNYGDHTALAFDRLATGNAAPKRIIRTAPAGTPTPAFGNPMAVAYDNKRGEILVPN